MRESSRSLAFTTKNEVIWLGVRYDYAALGLGKHVFNTTHSFQGTWSKTFCRKTPSRSFTVFECVMRAWVIISPVRSFHLLFTSLFHNQTTATPQLTTHLTHWSKLEVKAQLYHNAVSGQQSPFLFRFPFSFPSYSVVSIGLSVTLVTEFTTQ